MADVDKEDMTWVLWLREVGFGDAPAEGGGGGVVDDTEGVEAGDGGSILDGAALGIGVPARDSNDDIGDGGPELMRRIIAEFSQVHGYELCGRKGVLLAEIRHLEAAERSDQIDKGQEARYLCADGAVHVDEGGVEETLFIVEIGVEDGATDEPFERSDGVSEVGRLLGLCGLADSTLFGPKGDERTGGCSSDERGGEKGTHGVARLETSLTMMSMPRFLATPICGGGERGDEEGLGRADLAVESTEIDTDDGHGWDEEERDDGRSGR